MEEKKRTANFRKSRVLVILYTESEHTNEEPAQLLTETEISKRNKNGSLFNRHEAVSWPLQYKRTLNLKSTEE